jgi:hypothetical protein
MEGIKILLTFIGALFVFTLGLLAWRQQLLDKRKFEVAEEILLAFDKLKSAIQAVRAVPPREGMYDYITKERGIDPQKRYAYYKGMREWYYRITPEQREELSAAYKEFRSAFTLASIYLPETTGILSTLSTAYWQLQRAAKILGEIDPRPPRDPYWSDMLHELPDWPDDPDYEPTPESQIEKEKEHLWARYEDDPRDADAMNTIMNDAEYRLEQICEPHTHQGPYEFLKRFLMTLWKPIRVWARTQWLKRQIRKLKR